jgi:ribosome-binding factor A
MNKNIYIEKVETIVKKLLPKFIDKFESKHNFGLPKINIIEMDGGILNASNIIVYGENPHFRYVGVKVEVDMKDGRLGKAKKLITSVVEKVLDSLGYKYSEIYVEFIKTSDLDKEKIEKFEGLIRKLLIGNRKYKGWYSLPYSDSYDDGVDWVVNVLPYEIKLQQSNLNYLNTDKNCVYDVKIVLIVESMFVGSEENNEWERVYGINDLPESVWDEIKDDTQKTIENFLPTLCDYHILFKFNPRN